jgi:ATP-binding protein involved in chromosome partitioning
MGPSNEDLNKAVLAQLSHVLDPELGADIVTLGMVTAVSAKNGHVAVTVALTTPSCPLRGQIERETRDAIESIEGVIDVTISVGALDPEAKAALMDRARRIAQRDAPLTSIPSSARILAIASGKGGVGKSSVTANLATGLAEQGFCVGVLDADIWGFSIPRMLGLEARVEARSHKMVPIEKRVGAGTIKLLSMGLLADEGDAILWRGLLLNRAVQQFIEDAHWDGIDYLLIDLPPGTGDVSMGLARHLPRTEVLIVTTPPFAAQHVAGRVATLAKRSNLRVVGVIENMSAFTCEHGSAQNVFGSGGGKRLADEIRVPLLAEIPLDAMVVQGADDGTPAILGSSPGAIAYQGLSKKVATLFPPHHQLEGCSARLLDALTEAVSEE